MMLKKQITTGKDKN